MPARLAVRVAGQFILRFLLVFLTLVALGAALVILQLRTTVEPASVVAIGLVTGSIVLAFAVWLAIRFFARPLAAVIARVARLAESAGQPDGPPPAPAAERPEGVPGASAFKEVYNSLDRLHEALENGARARMDLQREREQWIAGVSHDLKSPLTAIRGYAELLTAEPGVPAEEVRRQARAILTRSVEMDRLLADLELTLRMRAGAFELPDAAVNLVPLVRDAVAELARDRRSLGRDLRFESSRRPVMVRGDDGLLRRAVANLLVNAVVHNPEGTTIEASVFEAAGGAEVRVSDDGVGMDESTLSRLFRRYSDTTRGPGDGEGSGLGMSVTRQLVEAHAGNISVDSSPGRGTRVAMWLPLDDGAALEAREEPGPDVRVQDAASDPVEAVLSATSG